MKAINSRGAPFPVLLYHAVDFSWLRGQEEITVPPDLFARHMDVLAERGLRVIPFGEVAEALLSGAELPANAVSVTFDDGYACLLRHAHPILADRGMRATLFQTTGPIGGSFCGSPMLTEGDLRELMDLGFEIGSHTVTHPHLDLVSPQQVRSELRDSRDRLEQVLGVPVTGLAYPHGSHTRQVAAAVRHAGYEWAAGVKDAGSHAADDPWAIARITMKRTVTPEDLGRILDGEVPLAWPRERVRTTVFRQVRRRRTKDGYDPNVSSDVAATRLCGPATALTVDLEDVPDLPGSAHRFAVVLVRRGQRPFAEVVVPVGADGLSAPAFREAIERELAASGTPSPSGTDRAQVRGPAVEISVVITTCAASDELLRAIDSVLASQGVGVDVIVVDNRPNSSGAEEAIRNRYPDDARVRVISEHRQGLSWARNAGIAAARTEFVAWTDDDVVVDPHWARFLVDAFALAPDVDLVTGLIRPLELGTEAQIWRELHRGYARGFDRRVYRADPRPSDAPLLPYATGRIGSGANMAGRRRALDDLGGFDVTLGAGTPAAGGEDLDLIFRFLDSGSAVVFEPAAIVSHTHHREFTDLLDQARDYGTGLASYLMTLITADPRRLADVARRSPAAAAHLRALRRGPKDRDSVLTDREFSRRLRRAETMGMAIGVRHAVAKRMLTARSPAPRTHPVGA